MKTYKQRRAGKLVDTAILRGKLIPGACARCGCTPPPRRTRQRRNIQAHHEDYDKPLEVIWLCHPCHVAVHCEERKNRRILPALPD